MTGKKRGRPRKDPFANLDDGFKADAEAASAEKLQAMISLAKMGEITAQQAMKADEDVIRLSGELKEAKRPYRETIEACNTRALYCRKVASDRAQPLPGTEEPNTGADVAPAAEQEAA